VLSVKPISLLGDGEADLQKSEKMLKMALLTTIVQWMKTAAVLIGDVQSQGRGICPLPSSPPWGIWQLKCPHPRKFATQQKNGNAWGLTRGRGRGSWNWPMRLCPDISFSDCTLIVVNAYCYLWRSVVFVGGVGNMRSCTFLKFIWSVAPRDPKTWCDSVWDKKKSQMPHLLTTTILVKCIPFLIREGLF